MVTLIVAIMAFWAVAVLALQRRVLYPRHLVGGAVAAGGTMERIAHDADRAEAWFLPPLTGTTTPAPTVVFAHGNGELIDFWPAALESYRRMGLGVLLVEYRGYGRSPGTPTQPSITDDFTAYRDQIAARPDVDENRLVYHGRSLGGGVVCALAAARPPRAVILESSFTSVATIAGRMGVPSFMVLDPYDNLAFVETSSLPILIIHGSRDQVIPFAHAKHLHAAAHDSRLHRIDGAGHNDALFQRRDYWQRISHFLQEAGIVERPEP